jgi:hypothetical protein
MFIAFGVAFAWGATAYNIGTAARMGPGYFPIILGVLLAVIGAVACLQALGKEANPTERFGSIAWKPLALVLGSVVVFGLIVLKLGLVIAIIALILIASRADITSWKQAIVLAIGMAIFCYLVFVLGIKLQFPVWPAFLQS